MVVRLLSIVAGLALAFAASAQSSPVDGVDYNKDNAADVVYQPLKAKQCDVAQDSLTPPKLSFHGFRNSQVRRPAEKIFFCDAAAYDQVRAGQETAAQAMTAIKGQINDLLRQGAK